MKKVVISIIAIIVIAGLAVGGFLLYRTSTPEYALTTTLKDVESDGFEGLKKHLTSDTVSKIEAIEDWSDQTGISGITEKAQESVVSLLKTKMSEIDWTIEEVLKGKDHTEAVIGFDYDGKISGTINVTMVKEDHKWKIDGLSFPQIDKISLW